MLHRGFTLIELMITIAIAAILLTVAVPGMQSFIIENRLTTLSNELVTDLLVAKSEAVRRGVRVSLCVRNTAGDACNAGGSWAGGWIAFADTNSNGIINAGETILKVHNALPTGIVMPAPTFATPNIVTYSPSGSLTPLAAGTFNMCRTGFIGRTIVVSTTGRTTTTRTAAVCP
jgi:type IV fimbrial biogenesis protein FimT